MKNNNVLFWNASRRAWRMHCVLQSQQGECGLACIAMITAALGSPSPLNELRARFRSSSRGTTLHQLCAHLDKLGFASRAVRLEVGQLKELSLPAILHWDMTHFVVLEKVGRDSIWIADPARGRRRISLDCVRSSFTGIALEAWTSGEPRGIHKANSSTFGMLGVLSGVWPTLLLLVSLTGVLEAIGLVAPLLSQWLVDDSLIMNAGDVVVTAGCGFVLLQIIQQAVTYIRGLIANHLGADLSLKRKTGFFRYLVRLPYDFFERRSVGDITSRFSSVDTIQQTLMSAVGTFIIDGAVVVASLLIMVKYNAGIALISVAALLVTICIRLFSFPCLRRLSADQIEQSAKSQSHLFETLRGIRTIQMFGRQRERANHWHNLLVAQHNTAYKSARVRSNLAQLCGLVASGEAIAVLCVGVTEVTEGVWTLGALMAFNGYRSNLSARALAMFDKTIDLVMLRLHFDRLSDITGTVPDEGVAECSKDGHTSLGDILLDGVTFRYAHGEPNIIKSGIVRIFDGECIALVGASGCGKTTLAKLLLGILEPTRGELSVCGCSGAQLRHLTRLGIIAAVMQDDILFAGTIEDNIHCFDASPDIGRVVACAIASQIHGEVMDMPMGYLTLVGDMGASLSGGQKQRLTLARALYRMPKVLILDEATSHLDLENEKLISSAVSDLRITRIVIAHRPETIASADRVIEIRDGDLIEMAR